ncbi:serine hydrolase family protein [Snodgrassella sp. ESL0323]|uniref:RBBP9/YdeN family alpha/beta hydrolase n=1 Tax=Snodgrassella sp. ESL0323 TaxID=2705034 RepID=UPI001582AA5B|nr:YqiA/YcfP family alpha/beta fold hydrolase [Snodgrassella sp. ESL0323]NUF79674.1 serine hydrolase family protein [Snodgrassella sp. ESL0323]
MTEKQTVLPARIFIVHGFQSSPQDNWFDWLATQIRPTGAEVTVPLMPQPDYPQAAQWQQTLDKLIGQPDEQTFLIGHSLGVITLLQFLSRHKPVRLGGLILVAGFAAHLPRLQILDGYIDASQPDFAVLQQISMPVHSIISTNDPYVPEAASNDIAHALHSSIQYIPDGGHLMAEDGFRKLEPARDSLQQMLAQAATLKK